MALPGNVNPGVSRDRVPDLSGRCDPVVERAIRDLYLRFYKFPAPQTTIQQIAPAAAPVQLSKVLGTGAYTIVFTIDGLVGDDQLTPSFTVNQLRSGFSPVVVSLTADFAPNGTLSVNFTKNGMTLLSSDITIPTGQTGPAFSTSFALAGAFNQGDKIRMKINSGAGAAQVVGEIVVKAALALQVK